MYDGGCWVHVTHITFYSILILLSLWTWHCGEGLNKSNEMKYEYIVPCYQFYVSWVFKLIRKEKMTYHSALNTWNTRVGAQSDICNILQILKANRWHAVWMPSFEKHFLVMLLLWMFWNGLSPQRIHIRNIYRNKLITHILTYILIHIIRFSLGVDIFFQKEQFKSSRLNKWKRALQIYLRTILTWAKAAWLGIL